MLNKKIQTSEKIIYEVQNEDVGKGLKIFLREKFGLSTRLLIKMKQKQNILVNNKFKKYNYKLNLNDIIEIIMTESDNEFERVKLNLNILYEDIDLLIINKESNIVTHPTKGTNSPTLGNGVAHYFNQNNIRGKIRFINRLDMDTSGVIIIGKNAFAHFDLMKQMEERLVKKTYLALVSNKIEAKGVINKKIYDIDDGTGRRVIDERGKESITEFERVYYDEINNISLVKLNLITGRTHQLRVHLSSINHPIVGDKLYGGADLIDRQALHAYQIEFKQPRYRDIINIKAEIPEDIKKLLNIKREV